jgi:TRAP-type C4-dicarboxylate transport system substrate-binding protein
MIMKKCLALLLAAAVGALWATGASAETIWRLSNWIPATHPVTVDILEVWAKQVENATQGRIKFQFVPALGAPPAHFDLVRNGVADVALIGPSYTPARFSLTRAAELPFLSDSSKASSLALSRAQEKFFAKANEFQGVKLAGIWTHGPAHIFSIKAPINSVADMKGLKIRTAGGIADDVARLAGAVPFFAPASQTYDVLSKGVADGILFPAESVPSFRLETIVRYGALVKGGIYQLVHAVIVNQAKWDALSPADKAAVDKVSGEALTVLASTVWDRLNAEGIAAMKKAGIQLHDASPAMMKELRTRYAGLLDAWYADAAKKGVDGKAAWSFIEATVQQATAQAKSN